MKKIYIAQTGSTFQWIIDKYGDFDQWTKDALGEVDIEVETVNVEKGETLPSADNCAGVVFTGSHSMVTENLPWSLRAEEWVRDLVDNEVPLLGICYGHQLIAKALGGEADFHKDGKEVGTVYVKSLNKVKDDPLFEDQPKKFLAHATHAQTVVKLPEGAVRLCSNEFEPNHAFRFGKCAWGVQFHPEFNKAHMLEYVGAQKKDLEKQGKEVDKILESVEETPVPLDIIRKFAKYVQSSSS